MHIGVTRTKFFPIYDDIAPLIEGRAATEESVFYADNNSPASPNPTSADEMRSESSDKDSVINKDNDEKKREDSVEIVGVFGYVMSLC